MALVSCKSCGHSISSWARSCPKCGWLTPAGAQDNRTAIGAPPSLSCAADASYQPAQVFEPPPHDPGYPAGETSVPAAEIIAVLDIDSDLKTVFMKLAGAEPRGSILGIRRYPAQDGDTALQYFRQWNTLATICSNMALLLGPFYYFFYTMWRKGTVLIVTELVLSAGVVLGSRPVIAMSLVGMALIHVFCYCAAKYDRYRSQVLEEVFWW